MSVRGSIRRAERTVRPRTRSAPCSRLPLRSFQRHEERGLGFTVRTISLLLFSISHLLTSNQGRLLLLYNRSCKEVSDSETLGSRPQQPALLLLYFEGDVIGQRTGAWHQ